jgi:hypothetical protein
VRPSGVEDSSTLRWALRSDGVSGFLFIAWHQPHVPLAVHHGARFEVVLETEALILPSQPVDIPPGTLARWPLRLTLGGVRLDWVTASAVTVLPGSGADGGGVPTLVLTASPGVPVEFAVGGVARPVVPSRAPVRVTTPAGAVDLLVLPAGDATSVWVCSDGPAGRRLLLSDSELTWGPSGRITSDGPGVLVYSTDHRRFTPLALGPGPATIPGATAGVVLEREAGRAVPVSYGKFDGRQSAPPAGVFDELAAVYRLEPPEWAADPAFDALLRIGWAGDVGELRVDGRTVTDRFWDGSEWIVSLPDAGYRPGSRVSLHLLPLAAGSPVWLPADARERLLGSDGQLLAVDYVRVAGRLRREEAS